MVLNGSLLNQVTGVYAERSGSRVNGIRAELLSSTDPARREVRVSALASAGPPWGVPHNLVLEYRLGSSPIKAPDPLRTPVQITAAASINVDLVISDCTFIQDPSDASVIFPRATIKNNGSEGAAFQTGQVFAKYQHPSGLGSEFKAAGGGEYIAPGGTKVISVAGQRFQPPSGSKTFTWTVDPSDAVAESNPANNERACTFTFGPVTPAAPKLPDLVISTITSRTNSGPPGTWFVFTLLVTNTGSADAPTDKVWPRCSIDGAHVPGGMAGSNPTLAPGQSVSFQWQTNSNFVPGTKRLECTIDPNNALVESTETNNMRSITFVVTSG